MACPCCVQSGACCTTQRVCNERQSSACTGTFRGDRTRCNICNDPALATCIISVVTEFGTIVTGCSSFGSQVLNAPCGSVRNASNSVIRTTGLRLTVNFVPATCTAFAFTTGARGCNSLQDGANVPEWYAHLFVGVGREDGFDGGFTEEIHTYYKILANAAEQRLEAALSWTGQARLSIGPCGLPTVQNPPAYSDFSYQRCLPCGFRSQADSRFSCGVVYDVWPNIDCCQQSLSHSLSIACAP